MEAIGNILEDILGFMIGFSGWILGIGFAIFMFRGKRVSTVLFWSLAAVISLFVQKSCVVKFQGLAINSGDGNKLAMDKFSPSFDWPIVCCVVLSVIAIGLAIRRNRPKDDWEKGMEQRRKMVASRKGSGQ